VSTVILGALFSFLIYKKRAMLRKVENLQSKMIRFSMKGLKSVEAEIDHNET